MSEPYGSNSSVKVLQWLTQYKKLSARPPDTLSEAETKTLKELETKLAKILNQSSGKKPDIDASRRTQLRVDANYHVQLATAHDFKKAYIKNISGGGLFIESKEMSPMGSHVTLQLILPKETEPISIKAEVAWTNPKKVAATPQGFGVKFVNLSEDHRNKIQKLVNESLERELKRLPLSKDKKS